MKLVIFTPAGKKSAIGRMAALVTRELIAHGCDVTIVRTESKHLLSTDMHSFGAPVISWNKEAEVSAIIRSADACIYQIGDNHDFHEGGIRWLSVFPGLVCLHDLYLGDLFYIWAQSDRAQAESILQYWYGEQLASQFFGFASSASFIDHTCDVMPMTEWICSQADGVITHSRWGIDRVLNSCPGPVRVVPLPYDAPLAITNTSNNTISNETLQLLTIGNVNPNKRVSSVVEAIGRSDVLKQRVTYRLVGAVQPEVMDSLYALASRLGVTLVISGEVSESELAQAIMESNVISCLRWPALEAASASAIEAMLYGKTIIVTNTGFYSEIPDTYVVKIPPDNEINALQSALEALVKEREKVCDVGSMAQQWALQTFNAQNYAKQIMEIIEQVARTVPARKAITNFCSILRQWSSAQSLFYTAELTDPLRIFEKHS
jgi:glycosyltransferase involved in cell wall biosynthesis